MQAFRLSELATAKEFSQVPRPSKGGRDIGVDEIKENSRGKNWSQDKANGATKVGREYVTNDGTKKTILEK